MIYNETARSDKGFCFHLVITLRRYNKIKRTMRYEKYRCDYLKQKEEGDYTLAFLLDG